MKSTSSPLNTSKSSTEKGFQIQADTALNKSNQKRTDSKVFFRLFEYVKPYKGLLAATVLLTVFGSVFSPLRPYITKIAIDDYIAVGDFEGLTTVSLALLGVILLDCIKIYGSYYLTQHLGQKAVLLLRKEIFQNLQKLNLKFFDRNPIGRLMTRATNDVESLNEMLSSGFVNIASDIFQLFFIVILMFILDWQLTLVTLSILPVIVYVTFVFKRKVRVVYEEVRTQMARLNAFLQEHITGISTIQLFSREDVEFKKHSEINSAHRNANIRSVYYYSVFYPTIEILSSVAMGMIIWFSTDRMLEGTLTVGVIVSFVQYVNQFFRPLQDLSEKYNLIQTAVTSAERIFNLLDEDSYIPEPQKPQALNNLKGAIHFNNVWFAYQDKNWILKDISFDVTPGQTIAIVGSTGSGKTSIINLLSKFYEPQQGSIGIDNTSLSQVTETELRQHLGVVMQDVFLFSGSIKENITLGRADISEEQIIHAAKLVGAHEFIVNLPQGYDYEVLERGGGLSTGQRQLISFVRAMVYNPKILVLDEATSSVDTETELKIEQAIEVLMKGRTSIIIAHRLSTVQRADKILVLHKGEIRETGSHQELLKQRGLYYKLFLLQYPEQLHSQPIVKS
jgi:ATP-binding cassette subfamily B protein